MEASDSGQHSLHFLILWCGINTLNSMMRTQAQCGFKPETAESAQEAQSGHSCPQRQLTFWNRISSLHPALILSSTRRQLVPPMSPTRTIVCRAHERDHMGSALQMIVLATA